MLIVVVSLPGGTLLLAINSLVDMTRTNVEYYKRTLGMARVDMMKRYSGSTIGVLWAIVRPSVFIAVFWFAVAVGFRGGGVREGVPVIFWLTAGIVPWFFVSESIAQAGSSIRKNSHLVTRLVYPVSTIPTFSVLSLFYAHLMLLGVVIAVFIASGQGLTVYFLQLPYYMLCAVIFSLVAAAFFSTLTALSKDVGHLIASIMTVLFWVTPIIWPLEQLEGTLKHVIMLNPITYLVQGYRNAFVFDHWFFEQWEYTLYFWGFMIVFALLTAFLFAKLKDDFADVL
jgi:ABC-type polysaccharide/polyol phosphate export permease